MSGTTIPPPSRRDFLQHTGRVAAAGTLAGMAVPHVHAAEDNTIRVALVGCGGRGTGAAADALSAHQGPVKLVAMTDIFEDRVENRHNNLKGRFGDQVDVPEDRRFVGFDGYKHAMDCLKPGDIVISATPPAFRWAHLAYAVDKGLHAFMEKPLTADGPTSRRMLDFGKQATAKNLKVGVGLMSRHARNLQQLHQRVRDGEIGDLLTMRAYRMHGWFGKAFAEKWPGEPSEVLWQLERFHSFLWASGGLFNDLYIHLIDHCCWMKGDWPVKAQSLGGRHYRRDSVDQNFDSYAVEYTFADGARLFMHGRAMAGAHSNFSSALHGTKGCAVASRRGDCGGPSSTFEGHNFDGAKRIWQSETPGGEGNPYRNQWNALIDAIRADEPFNEVEHGVMASVVSSLGRKAAHTAQEITLDAMLNSPDEYAPGLDEWTTDPPAPVQADDDGNYPIPMPGILTDREY